MFSKAEQLVVNYLLQGLSNKEIADRICICEKTVKFHLSSIYKKAGVKTRFEFFTKNNGQFIPKEEVKETEIIYSSNIKGDTILETGSKPIMPIQEARRLEQGARQVQVIGKSQEDKITFIDDKFKVGETITQLHQMMKDVTSKELTPNTVNAACNCVARLNETINTAIQAARFLNER